MVSAGADANTQMPQWKGSQQIKHRAVAKLRICRLMVHVFLAQLESVPLSIAAQR